MAKIEMKGLDEYTRALNRLERGLRDEVCGAAIYDAADIVADAIREGIDALPTDGGLGSPDNQLRGPTMPQKDGLQRSFGITKLRVDDGVYNVKIGFAGYNSTKTKRWPKGQPNAMVARSVERGTSFMAANPFIKRAMARAKKQALGAMRSTIDERIHALMEK